MQSAFYVSLSAQVALDKRLTTIAENVANASTTGFRATGVSFDAALSRAAAGPPTAYVSAGDDFISRASGGLTKTDNPLDLAVIGDA
jgi:flagellar basal-body rod protein FlgF